MTPRAFFSPPLVGVPLVPGIVQPPDPVFVLSLEPFEPSFVSVPADRNALIRSATIPSHRAGTPSGGTDDQNGDL